MVLNHPISYGSWEKSHFPKGSETIGEISKKISVSQEVNPLVERVPLTRSPYRRISSWEREKRSKLALRPPVTADVSACKHFLRDLCVFRRKTILPGQGADIDLSGISVKIASNFYRLDSFFPRNIFATKIDTLKMRQDNIFYLIAAK